MSLVDYHDICEPDTQYRDLLREIIDRGRPAKSGMDEGSTEILGYTLRFDLANGFPIITERDLTRGTTPEIIANYKPNPARRPVAGAVKQGLGEILGFINGARTQEELKSFGCKFWKPWTTDEKKAAKRGLKLGDLGPGSYGAAFHNFPSDTDENGFDQYKAMIAQIKNRPELRTHIIVPFIPPLISRAPGRTQKVLVVPCHGLQHYNIDVENREISLVHWQRSADVPIGLPFNLIHYTALLMMIGQITGYKPRELIFQLSNAHIYDQHRDKIREILSRKPFAFPKLYINDKIKNIHDFRVDDFEIEDYVAHPPINMGGTAV